MMVIKPLKKSLTANSNQHNTDALTLTYERKGNVMAYAKRRTSYSTSRRTGGKSRRGSSTRNKRTYSGRSGRTSSTLRIVVEAPQQVSSVAPQSSAPARKAVF